MVMTDELKQEWNKHESSFAKKWLENGALVESTRLLGYKSTHRDD